MQVMEDEAIKIKKIKNIFLTRFTQCGLVAFIIQRHANTSTLLQYEESQRNRESIVVVFCFLFFFCCFFSFMCSGFLRITFTDFMPNSY